MRAILVRWNLVFRCYTQIGHHSMKQLKRETHKLVLSTPPSWQRSHLCVVVLHGSTGLRNISLTSESCDCYSWHYVTLYSAGNSAMPVSRSSSIIHHWSSIIHHWSSVIHHWSLIIDRLGVSPGSVAILHTLIHQWTCQSCASGV